MPNRYVKILITKIASKTREKFRLKNLEMLSYGHKFATILNMTPWKRIFKLSWHEAI